MKKIASSLLKLPIQDHRQIGLKQKLFFFSELSQGSCFFEPRGAHIYNKLIDYLREEYKKRKYQEVITPNIFNCDLWKTSGHWDHFKDDMIKFQLGEREFSLKPMNCPGHCVLFKNQKTKFDDELPIRWADFGVLHRNELSGTLLGLSRVRRFQQDDAHIFCTPNQVEAEVKDCLQFATDVYSRFGFSTFDLKLSLRPQSYMGDEGLWDKAEDALRRALGASGINWEEQKYEGAFYGPKIDLVVRDCNDKAQQCATIQLDFQLPERFELTYRDKETRESKRPVIIHRAILGSIERFIAMIAENCNGKWPFWLSPLQAQIIPIHPNFCDYAQQVCDEFRDLDFWVDCDTSNETMNAKLRDALLTSYNLILVVGKKEMESRSVTCRVVSNDRRVHNISMPIEKLVELFHDFIKRRVNCPQIELLELDRDRDYGKD